jgi:hypothetical protein
MEKLLGTDIDEGKTIEMDEIQVEKKIHFKIEIKRRIQNILRFSLPILIVILLNFLNV